jgi:hypothetical protein
MPTGKPSENSSVREVAPARVQELRASQDRSCGRIRASLDSVCSELRAPLEREDRMELAAAVADTAADLRALIQQKDDAGYFEGSAGNSQHLRERVAHLRADLRRLLNELRAAQQEISTGKASKAVRQLTSWLGHFDDVVARESELISELWRR